MSISMSLGQMLKSLLKSVGSVFTTGTWQVEKAADEMQTADLLLDQVKEASDEDAKNTLDHVDKLLTTYHGLEIKAEEIIKEVIADLQSNVERAADEAKKYKQGTAERNNWERLVKQALTNKLNQENLLVPIMETLDESKDEYEQALQAVERVGLDRQTAISQRDHLQITGAMANAQLNMAIAARSSDKADHAKELLAQASEKVNMLVARAKSKEEIAAHSPMSASQVDAELDKLTRDDKVNAEFARLMGTDTETKILK